MTGRASDGSDSYSYIWSVAACGSAISGEAAGLQRDEGEGGAAITEKLSLTPSSSPAMLTRTDDTHVKGDWFPLHRCSWRP